MSSFNKLLEHYYYYALEHGYNLIKGNGLKPLNYVKGKARVCPSSKLHTYIVKYANTSKNKNTRNLKEEDRQRKRISSKIGYKAQILLKAINKSDLNSEQFIDYSECNLELYNYPSINVKDFTSYRRRARDNLEVQRTLEGL